MQMVIKENVMLLTPETEAEKEKCVAALALSALSGRELDFEIDITPEDIEAVILSDNVTSAEQPLENDTPENREKHQKLMDTRGVSPQKETEAPDREAIKKELNDLGVMYNQRAQTSTLAALLADIKSKKTPQQEVEHDASPETPQEEEVPQSEGELSLEDTIETLKKYAAVMGEEKTFALIQGFGAKKVSDITAGKRIIIVEKATAELKARGYEV